MLIVLSPLVGTWFQVLFHSPNRGAFHFSVALLFAIGRQGVLSLGRWASRIHATFHGNRVTRGISGESVWFRIRGYHPLWLAFQSHSATTHLCNSLDALPASTKTSQPPTRNGGSLTRVEFGHDPRSLAATYGVDVFFPFLRVLRCFSSPRQLPKPMDSASDDQA